MLFCRLWIFCLINFLKKSFRNTIRVSNNLDTDQARHFVGPDLGPNCLKKGYQQTTKVATRGERVNYALKTCDARVEVQRDDGITCN